MTPRAPARLEENEVMRILHRQRRPRSAVSAGTLLLLTMLLYGCGAGGGGGGDSSTNSTPTPTSPDLAPTSPAPAPASPAPAPASSVSGMASKGPLAGATITIFTLLPNGQRGSQIVPGAGQPAIITQANGSWTAAIPGDVTGPLLVVTTGGTFLDEVTGRQIPIGDTTDILGLLPAGATTAAITPITHAMALAAQTALQRAAATGTSPDVNTMVSTVIFNATQTFGFDPVRTLPPYPRNLSGQTTVAVHYAAILVGLSQLLADARGREAAGQQAGQSITAPNGQVVPSLIPTPQTKTLADVVNIFALFPPTDTGLDDTTLQSTLS